MTSPGMQKPFWWEDVTDERQFLNKTGRSNNGTLKIQNPIHGRLKGYTGAKNFKFFESS